jgi:hypothetical protein
VVKLLLADACIEGGFYDGTLIVAVCEDSLMTTRMMMMRRMKRGIGR